MAEEAQEKYLYKIVSKEHWQESQKQKVLSLSSDDDAFIHFSKEDQLQRICDKYWAHVPEYMVLKVDTAKLPGDMVFEANPGGTAKYYHLYNGSIPFEAVISSKVIKSKNIPSQ